MENEASLEGNVVAVRDLRRQEQEERLKVLVQAQDYVGAAALQAEMQKEAEVRRLLLLARACIKTLDLTIVLLI